jgi:hypothetical protein
LILLSTLAVNCKNTPISSGVRDSEVKPSVPQSNAGQSRTSSIASAPTLEKAALQLNYGFNDTFILVERGRTTTYASLDSHRLHLVRGGKIVDTIEGVVSGSPGKQDYLPKSSPGPSGSNKPLPEGIYSLSPPQADGKPAVGKWFVPIVPDPPPRSLFGIHKDGNRDSDPGTAGCLGLPDEQSLDKYMGWMRGADAPRRLVVNWDLGTLTSSSGLALIDLFDFALQNSKPPTLEDLAAKTNPTTGEIMN